MRHAALKLIVREPEQITARHYVKAKCIRKWLDVCNAMLMAKTEVHARALGRARRCREEIYGENWRQVGLALVLWLEQDDLLPPPNAPETDSQIQKHMSELRLR